MKAVIPETEGSWALPLLHERITSFSNPIEKAAAQLRLVSQNLPMRPLSLWDAEYGCASFVKQTADIMADKLMRKRSNRLLYRPPPPYTGIGRPRVHGNKQPRIRRIRYPTVKKGTLKAKKQLSKSA